LRVGTVPYLVARPLDMGLEAEAGIQLTRDLPANLVASLRAGDLDVALVSSIELFRRDGYTYLPGLCVAANGHISSVLMFHRCPLPELRSVALDPASHAARALLQVVLSERGIRPEFLDIAAGADPRAASSDAWLRIGDAALREGCDPTSPDAISPSTLWREITSLPFPYAVWIVREGVDLSTHLDCFRRARTRGADSMGDLIRMGARTWDLDEALVHRYLAEESIFELGDELPRALSEFRDRAAALGLCEGARNPRPHAPLSPEGLLR
jgi:chorismate dehydratase